MFILTKLKCIFIGMAYLKQIVAHVFDLLTLIHIAFEGKKEKLMKDINHN